MPTVATASPITFQLLPSTTVTPQPATTKSRAGQVFNPLYGYITRAYPLDGAPVIGSRIQWFTTTDPGTKITFLTSINYGASWDVATNSGPIPRLAEGDRVTRMVLVKAIFTRVTEAHPLPKLHRLVVRIATPDIEDELLPTFFGGVDKSKVKHGAGSGSGGGGMFGFGTTVKLHAADLSRTIALNKWGGRFVAPAGATCSQISKALIVNRRPTQTLFSIASNPRVPSEGAIAYGLAPGGNPWKNIEEFHAGYGSECWFDGIGVFVAQPVPDPRRGFPAWMIDSAVILEGESELDDKYVINRYAITGTAPSTLNPVRAVVENRDPASRTNIDRIGPRTDELTFPNAETEAQCRDIGVGLLNTSMSLANTATYSIPANPALVPGDIVRIDDPNTGVHGNFLLQGFELRDGQGRMPVTVFRQSNNPDAQITLAA